MNEIVMNNVEKQIFRAICSDKFIRRDLIKFIKEREICSSATLDRTLVKFINWGLIVKGKKEGEYPLAQKGREYQKSIEVKPELIFKNSGLEKIINKLPTEAHRGLVYFILAAIVVKKYLWNDFEDFWPGFIIAGKPGDIKTTIAKIVCKVLGLSFKEHIQNAIPKSARQVIGTAYQLKGVSPPEWRINPAEYWSYPFIAWDEVDKVENKEVWRALFLYLDGHRTINERKTDIDDKATCLVCMNFETTKLKIQTYYLRRSFVVDSKALFCDPKQNEIIGDDIMRSAIPRLKIDGLPVAIRTLEKKDRDFLRDLLYGGLKSKEEGEVVDTGFLEKIVLGMLILQESGDVREYCYWAAEKALCFLQTQGRTKEAWREELIQAWGNYRLGKDPEFDKAWEEKLRQIKEDENRVKTIKDRGQKVEIDKDIKKRVLLASYSPKLDKLKKIRDGFKEMNGNKHSTTLLYLNMDIRKFNQKLPTEKRDNKVTDGTLRELETVLKEWQTHYKPIREAWGVERKRVKEAKEQKEKHCRYLAKLKKVLNSFKGKTLNGVLWRDRTAEIIANIGLVLSKETHKQYFNKPFLNQIDQDAQSLINEHKAQEESIKEVEDKEKRLKEKQKLEQDKFKREKNRVKKQYETLEKIFKTYAKLTGGMAKDHNQRNERLLEFLFSQIQEAKDIDALTSISSVIEKDIEDVNSWIEKEEAGKERKKRKEEEKKENVKREQELNRKIQAIKKKKNELSEKLAKPLTWRDYDDAEKLEKNQIKAYLNRKEFDKRTISNMFTLAKKYLRKMDFEEKWSYHQKLPFEEQLEWSIFDDWYLASGKTYLLENIKLIDLKEILTGRIKEIDDERKIKLIEQRDALGKEEQSLKPPLYYLRTDKRLIRVRHYLGEKEDQRLHFELEDGRVWNAPKGKGWTVHTKIDYGSESFPFISEEGSTIVVQTNEGTREISKDRIFCYIYEYGGSEPS